MADGEDLLDSQATTLDSEQHKQLLLLSRQSTALGELYTKIMAVFHDESSMEQFNSVQTQPQDARKEIGQFVKETLDHVEQQCEQIFTQHLKN